MPRNHMTAATKTGARAAKAKPKAPARPKAKPSKAKVPAKIKAAPKAATKAPSRPKGGQTLFTPAIAARISSELAKGIPLTIICAEPGMPADRTVRDWMGKDEAFAADIARAREEGFDRIALDALDIADERSRDTIQTEHGEKPDTEWIARSKLRIETRLKLLAKWDPKRYGDKTTTEITGAGGGAVQHSIGLRFVESEAVAKIAGSSGVRFVENEA